MLDKIPDLSSLGLPGGFGARNEDLIWLIITATLMFAGPALLSMVYLLTEEAKERIKLKPLFRTRLPLQHKIPVHA
jgi:hypothetical protein